MCMKAFYCIDIPRKNDLQYNIDELRGWILSTEKIENIWIKLKNDKYKKAEYNINRPDVVKNFGLYPNKEKCGFHFKFNKNNIDTFFIKLQLKLKSGRQKKISFPVNFINNNIISVYLKTKINLINIFSNYYEKKIYKNLKKSPWLSLRLDIINKCNLRCVMCHYQDESYYKQAAIKLEISKFDGFFKRISPFVKTIILSCAFEPLMSNKFNDIISLLYEKYPNVDVGFCTNAMLLNEKIRKLLIEKNVKYTILSLDGIKRKTLESIRKGSDYNKIIANIKALRDLKNETNSTFPILSADFVMMNSNIEESLLFIDLCLELKISSIDFRHVVPISYFKKKNEMLSNHKAKFNYFYSEIIKKSKNYNIKIHIPDPFNDVIEKWFPEDKPEINLDDFNKVIADKNKKLDIDNSKFEVIRNSIDPNFFKKFFCHQPFTEMIIVDQDIVKPCPWYGKSLGRISEGKDLFDIFFGKGFKEARKNMLSPNNDSNCEGCPVKENYFVSNNSKLTFFSVLKLLFKKIK